MEVKITKIEINIGAGRQREDYAQIECKGEEVGFVNKDGVFLRFFIPGQKFGAYRQVLPPNTPMKTFREKLAWVKKHWDSIYDNYNLFVK